MPIRNSMLLAIKEYWAVICIIIPSVWTFLEATVDHLVTSGATDSDKPSTTKTTGQSAEGDVLSNSRAAYCCLSSSGHKQGDLCVII